MRSHEDFWSKLEYLEISSSSKDGRIISYSRFPHRRTTRYGENYHFHGFWAPIWPLTRIFKFPLNGVHHRHVLWRDMRISFAANTSSSSIIRKNQIHVHWSAKQECFARFNHCKLDSPLDVCLHRPCLLGTLIRAGSPSFFSGSSGSRMPHRLMPLRSIRIRSF